MPDDPLEEADVRRALELAEGHLEDAENVLWNASSSARAQEHAEALETLTKQIWAVQHTIYDVKQELENTPETEPDDGFTYRDE